MPLGSYLAPPQGSQFYTYGNLTKLNRNDPWSSTKIVEMVLICCLKEYSNYAPSIKWGPVWGHI